MLVVVYFLFCSNLSHEYVALKKTLFESIFVRMSEHFITKIMLILSHHISKSLEITKEFKYYKRISVLPNDFAIVEEASESR